MYVMDHDFLWTRMPALSDAGEFEGTALFFDFEGCLDGDVGNRGHGESW